MSNKKQFVGRDAFYRMKYLHQLADMCRQKTGDDYGKLMLYYGSQIVSIGKKTQSRMSPKMKRTICKGCNALLVTGDTQVTKFKKCKKQPDKLINTCIICGTSKVFNLRKDYKLWVDKPEAVINKIDTKIHDRSVKSNVRTNLNAEKLDNQTITCSKVVNMICTVSNNATDKTISATSETCDESGGNDIGVNSTLLAMNGE